MIDESSFKKKPRLFLPGETFKDFLEQVPPSKRSEVFWKGFFQVIIDKEMVITIKDFRKFQRDFFDDLAFEYEDDPFHLDSRYMKKDFGRIMNNVKNVLDEKPIEKKFKDLQKKYAKDLRENLEGGDMQTEIKVCIDFLKTIAPILVWREEKKGKSDLALAVGPQLEGMILKKVFFQRVLGKEGEDIHYKSFPIAEIISRLKLAKKER